MRGHQDVQRTVEDVGDLLGRQDRVDDAVGVEVLRGLDAVGERPAVERLVDARTEEAHERARLGDGDVAERAPRRHHAAGGGVAEVDEVGETRGAVGRDSGRDAHHLHEGGRALLHAGAAADRGGDQGESLAGGALDAGDDPVRRGAPDRAGQEGELAHQHADPSTVQPCLAGQDRLVDARLLGRGGQLGGVLLAHAGSGRGDVPGGPRTVVEDQVDQVVGGESGRSSARLADHRPAAIELRRPPRPSRGVYTSVGIRWQGAADALARGPTMCSTLSISARATALYGDRCGHWLEASRSRRRPRRPVPPRPGPGARAPALRAAAAPGIPGTISGVVLRPRRSVEASGRPSPSTTTSKVRGGQPPGHWRRRDASSSVASTAPTTSAPPRPAWAPSSTTARAPSPTPTRSSVDSSTSEEFVDLQLIRAAGHRRHREQRGGPDRRS